MSEVSEELVRALPKTDLHLEIYQKHLERGFRNWIEVLRSQTFIERKGHFADAAMLGKERAKSCPLTIPSGR